MRLDLVNSTAVLVAHRFNPSIVRDYWLLDHGILERDDFQPGCVFTDMMVQVRSREFDLLVAPENFQFKPNIDPVEQQQLVTEKVGKIVEMLPHTPYTAVGLNFQWHFLPEHRTVEELSRDLFFVAERPLHGEFNTPDARFGGYLSKDAIGFRMKLDVKPVVIQAREALERHLIQMNFNFHLDLPDDQGERIQEIAGALSRWDEARKESIRISNSVAEGDAQ